MPRPLATVLPVLLLLFPSRLLAQTAPSTWGTSSPAPADPPLDVPVSPSPSPLDVHVPVPVHVPDLISSPLPPPDGLGDKRRLRDDDYAAKKQGGYFTGLPIANYDPTTLFGFGGRLYYYFDGYRDDPRFAYTPYLHRFIAQAFVSTAGAQDHLLDYDAPLFMGSLFRIHTAMEYTAATAWPYYGTGSRSMAPLAYSGEPGRSFGSATDFDDAKRRVLPDGTTYSRYNQYFFRRPVLLFGLERLMLGGRLRPLVGASFSYSDVRQLSGREADAVDGSGNDVSARQGPTLLGEDCAARRITGCKGGFDNVLRLAISYDTRDLEPDPNSGIYAEISTEISTKGIGSDFDYIRTLGVLRGYYSPFPKLADVVLAGRVLYQVQSSSTPFFSQQILPFVDGFRAGLGGLRTLRGYAQNRFVGPVSILTNYEVRWTFTHVHVMKQDFGLMLVPFLDIGRVFDAVDDTTLRGWKRSQGAGFRIGWNEATVIATDFGFSEEGSALYVNFNHIF